VDEAAATMSDLLSMLRDNDLPPKWDGRVIVWQGWQYAPSGVHVCPTPQREVCEGCGMPTLERGFPCWSTNRGLRADSTVLTLDDYREEEAARADLPRKVQHKLRCHWWIELTAFRCHHCSLDTVWDMTTGDMWRLDHMDYGDEGSVAP
jgi:hypothetical protein